MFKLRAVPSDVVLRGLAISAIVVHHSHDGNAFALGLGGGMTFLFMLAGMNWARFGMKNGSEARLRQSIANLARGLFFPSLLALVASMAIRRQLSWTELLYIQNWFSQSHVALFPEWFVQVMLQILLVLYLLASVPVLARRAVRSPATAVMVLFGAGLLLRAIGPWLWNTKHLEDGVPHMQLWNFALGGVVFFLGREEHGAQTRLRRIVAVLCVLAAAVVAWRPGQLEFWWLIGGGFGLIWVRDLRLPAALAQTAGLISGASFAIFLMHLFWFRVLVGIYTVFWGQAAAPHPTLSLVFAMMMSVGSWMAFTAFKRAYRTAAAKPHQRVVTVGAAA